MHYLLIVAILFILELVYFKIADRFNIIDKPNHRSSHTSITLRGGGIIFPVAMFVACVLGNASLAFTVGVVLVGLVSFIDDIKPLHQLPRIASHLIAIALVLYDLQLLQGTALYWLPVLIVLSIGWINAFNFMDGINGITVLYALVTIVSFGWIFKNDTVLDVLIIMAMACIVFGFFNVRKKAKTFAGDVGSVSMALFLAYFMIKLIAQTGQAGYILFFGVYGVDAVITILYRLKNKENIFQPHRSHLYQYLANEMKWPHVAVSLTYAVLQFLINIIVIVLIDKGLLSIPVCLSFLIVLAVIYLAVRISVIKKIAQNA
ncbi:UDP-GlcNAc--UDP-phosphate GlcNAc-1-phosphate transferase [Flavobacterium sp. DG1-102-2]|uniref:UDP-GlcNAc--UDP-phosphate GlcNAc-1-phosphate transferase n=1 Tax=Flavobacterium sp. DG1-102-2 TaxID=3081663 RepID=UPI0029491B2E|nr:UDP-GlcNAc--UDP-phosphate GlcNAc-1-phosphate transferase [Flavobacterium sp. DG1-102-2]MDV6168398.1 UDP-GlcNAc--UDP-phosphate GlcNAc-1-phosphate transferase [Flavobacterium sp. DG1-102-2]